MPHWIVGMRGLVGGAALLAALMPLAGAQPAQAERKPKVVYLTFDDGPNAMNTPRLLKVLAREHVPATFFQVGQFLAADPGYATRLWLAGHAVGNHTWSHADLTLLAPTAIRHQLRSTEKLMGRAAGKCMRPPYGAMNPTVSAVAAGLGMAPVMWTVDPQDWAHQDAAYITSHVLTHVRNRSIVLLHDGGGPRGATIAAVRALIPQLRLGGYEFRTIPACRVPFGGSMTGAAKQLDKPQRPEKPVRPPVQPVPTDPAPAGMGS